MIRINKDEARDFIPASQIDDAKYYCLFPCVEERWKGWEEVKYYSSPSFKNYSGQGDTFIYIMSNESIPNQYKIGYTTKDPKERAKQLSSNTNTPTPFKVEWYFKCYRGDLLEQEIHSKLDEYRVNSHREFFCINIEQAKQIIKELGQNFTGGNTYDIWA